MMDPSNQLIDGLCLWQENGANVAFFLIDGSLCEVPYAADRQSLNGETSDVGFNLYPNCSTEPTSPHSIVFAGQLRLKSQEMTCDIVAYQNPDRGVIRSLVIMDDCDYIRSERIAIVIDSFPWADNLGLELLLANGDVATLTDANLRPSPLGPLLKTRVHSESGMKEVLYNEKAFKSGGILGIRNSLAKPSLVQTVLPLIVGSAARRLKHKIQRRDQELALQTQRDRAAVEAARRKQEYEDRLWQSSIEIEERKTREWEERRHNAEQTRRRVKLESARLALEFDKARQFDLLIFDLDGTLLATDSLESFRGSANLGGKGRDYEDALSARLKEAKELIAVSDLIDLRNMSPALKFAVVTRAPRQYAMIVLKTFYPAVNWDAVVAFEDVGRAKPDPEGFLLACKQSGVKDHRRVLVIGDSDEDIDAAYRVGFSVALFTKGWGSAWRLPNEPHRANRYNAIHKVPDALLASDTEILDVLTVPERFLPLAEHYLIDSEASHAHNARGVVEVIHFNNLDSHPGANNLIRTKVLGRYFPSHSSFSQLHQSHALTQWILKAKDGHPYPEPVVKSVADQLNNMARINRNLIVCPVPARPFRPRRVEALVESLRERVHPSIQCAASDGILAYREGVMANKELAGNARYENIRDHLYVAEPAKVFGQSVVILDDVVTSGATLFYAEQRLREAGAESVTSLAIAQSVRTS